MSAEKTPCSDVLSEVWLFLDSECDRDRRDALQQHLDECSPCLAQYGLSEQLKVLLARKCGGEQAPDEFRERVRASIRQTVIQHRGARVEVTSARVEVSAPVEQRDD
ncbi:mycothiol system anti-sigma-R factor [Actinokineospora diospyrosa]|uniref:Mycothiol system anti-sigma-R factor n=1 Tax=Actinokineospora diospyrosa TaxID=103728 RepID=A0ABT1I7N0_9PSEU|nr:mycothiol system anti-sigma-R factor [Actinokineospora diospyrosa]MCP2268581.1 mycothiol system anti-sigma-R factor [Actinokineospora diospyrosa]